MYEPSDQFLSTVHQVSSTDSNWLDTVVHRISEDGIVIVTDVLSADLVSETRHEMDVALDAVKAEIGNDRLIAAGEAGVARIPMKYSSHFFTFFEIPELLAIIDKVIGPTAICHLQNVFVLPSTQLPLKSEEVFQVRPHPDFFRYMNGYVASLNTLVVISDFSMESGATWALAGSHQLDRTPTDPELASEFAKHAVQACCEPGSIIVFDSTLWHAAGNNTSGKSRYAINHQWTKSFFKQQIDYVRALGEETVRALPPRTQQLLGWYTRVVTSVDEYYRSGEDRLYRSGQG